MSYVDRLPKNGRLTRRKVENVIGEMVLLLNNPETHLLGPDIIKTMSGYREWCETVLRPEVEGVLNTASPHRRTGVEPHVTARRFYDEHRPVRLNLGSAREVRDYAHRIATTNEAHDGLLLPSTIDKLKVIETWADQVLIPQVRAAQ